MEANQITIVKETSASKKLQAADATALLVDANNLIVVKGKHVSEFKLFRPTPPAAIAAMLGPTGNLRAPTIKFGQTLIVGYHDAVFAQYLA